MYVTKEIIDEVEKEWKGEVIYKEGTARSNGLMILLNHQIHSEDIEVVKRLERFIIIRLKTENVPLHIINCYSPNTTTDKIRFFETLQHDIQRIDNDNVIVVGNFNVALDNSTDKIAGQPHPAREIDAVRETIAVLNLYDSWRIKPSRKTVHMVTVKPVQCSKT